MADYIVVLTKDQEPRDGDVEVSVMSGPRKGVRYSVRPKAHTTCHGTGRIVRVVQRGKRMEGVPGVCDCVMRPVERELGKGVQLEARWLTEEQRAKVRAVRVGAELANAKQELAEILTKRDTVVEQCRAGTAEARGKVEMLAQEDQAVREALALQKDEAAAAEVELARARERFEAAKLAAEHSRLALRGSEQRLERIMKARAGAQDTAMRLDREATRIMERPDYVAAIGSARRKVERLEQETKAAEVPAAEAKPDATEVAA